MNDEDYAVQIAHKRLEELENDIGSTVSWEEYMKDKDLKLPWYYEILYHIETMPMYVQIWYHRIKEWLTNENE